MKSIYCIVMLLIITLAVSYLSADTIIITGGEKITGTIMGYSVSNIYIEMENGRRLCVDKSIIESIEANQDTKDKVKAKINKPPQNILTYTKYWGEKDDKRSNIPGVLVAVIGATAIGLYLMLSAMGQ